MKKVFWALCTVVLLSTCAVGLTACDKSAPEFEGSPISATGAFRWEGDRIYLDVTVTNNTNKDIKWINASHSSWRILDGETDWRQASGGGAGYSPKPKALKPGANTTYNMFISWSKFENTETGETRDYIAAKTCLSVSQIDFGSHGLMSLDDNSVVFDFEGHK